MDHGDDVLARGGGVQGGPQSHYEVSQRQQAHQIQKNVDQVSLAPISEPANRNKGDGALGMYDIAAFSRTNPLAICSAVATGQSEEMSPRDEDKTKTHHFISRYFLQTGWLRSSIRLFFTIACKKEKKKASM